MMTKDGTVVTWDRSNSAIWSPGKGPVRLPISAGYCPLISEDGSKVVYDASDGLAIYDVASGINTQLVKRQVANNRNLGPVLITISNDARWALVDVFDGAEVQLAIVDTFTGVMKNLTSEASGVQDSVLSGDGSTVYAVSGDGQLLRFDTTSGNRQLLVASQPSISGVEGAPVAGSLNRIRGYGLSGTPRVTLNGTSLPVVSSSNFELDVQLPWATPNGAATLQIDPVTPTPFKQTWPITIQTAMPLLAARPIHGDFRGFVDDSSPAVAGEAVQFYLTGLGPVTPSVADGFAAPASPLSTVAAPFALESDTMQSPAQILYQGLAPGLIGIYQLSVQLPAKILPPSPSFRGPVRFNLSLRTGSKTTLDLSVEALPN
jgi:uncharacterized protein (TIGR03437 family)